ncbi:MAG TPA: ABC transporter permease [Acidimicrobiales bacterium]|nr:ABC transporter permease [Acidimicrobiales bacterium]
MVIEVVGEAEPSTSRSAEREGVGERRSRVRRRTRERFVVLAGQLLVIGLLVLAMQLVNANFGGLTMPAPGSVLRQLGHLVRDGVLGRALAETLTVFGIGYGVSLASGVLLGMVVGGFRTIGRIWEPFINALNATPRVAFIPLIIVWFGLFVESKVIVAWLSAFVPILINTADGIQNADQDLIEMAKALGTPRRTLFWRVLVPAALPSILTGVRVGAALAILGTIVAELYTAQAGLGGLLAEAGNTFQMAEYFAVVIVLAALGTAVSALLRMLERRFAAWRVDWREGS